MEEIKEYDKERGITITYDKRGRAFASFSVSGVPLPQFEVWNKCCEEEFNSARWQKIFMDHKLVLNTLALINPPEVLQKEEQVEKKKITTLIGGETIEDE